MLNNSTRKPCRECPWIIKSDHNARWPKYVAKMTEVGKIQHDQHRCHMLDANVWESPTVENVCIGSLNNC